MAFKRFQPQFPLPPQLQGYIFIDVEASGLHSLSYPVEIGWATCDLVADSFLIRPHARWGDDGWSYASERVHGLTRQRLIDDGIDVVEAAHRLNGITRGRTAISDNPEYDSGWIGRLFFEAEVPCAFHISDAAQLERMAAILARLAPQDAQALQERVKVAFPHPHRAAADARRAAALFLAVALPEEIEAVIEAA